MKEEKDLVKQMKEDTLSTMDAAVKELMEIVEPINNTGRISYNVASRFLQEGRLGKAWEQIKRIVNCQQYLRQFL